MTGAAGRVLLAFALAASLLPGAGRAQSNITVFAAASLKNVMDDIAQGYDGARISLSYGASSALARQIQYGAPAHLFVSASPDWMDVLEADGLLAADSRHKLLGNRLVLVAAPGWTQNLTLADGPDLAAILGEDRLAMALVDAVPAGQYGKAALIQLGLWDQLKNKIAQADNVRAALRLVARGEAPLGIVYATDARAEPDVRVLDAFAPDIHPEIVYPAAIIADFDTRAARDFLSFLTSQEAQRIFAEHGFTRPKGSAE